jgi:hypothetical protein
MAHLTPIQPIVTALMLNLRRRYLENHIDRPFDPAISLELDAVIVEQGLANELARIG